jgi:hypothetical protein
LSRPAPARGASKPETTFSGAAIFNEILKYIVDVTLGNEESLHDLLDLCLCLCGDALEFARFKA